MSFSKYPNQLDDDASLPETVDLVTPVRAEVVNRLRDAIIATQTEAGTNPSGTFGTVRARLDAINGLIETLSSRVNSNDTDISTLQSDLATLEATIAALQAEVDSLSEIVAVANQVVIPIVSGIENTDSTTFTAMGAGVLNPDNLGYPTASFTLEVILQTTDSSYAADFELFNITEGLAVSHPAVSTTSTSAAFISVALTIGGSDLPSDQTNLLEGRIKLGSGAAASDRAIIKYAAIRVAPA